MSKFNSDWIERNVYYRDISEPGATPHYEQHERPVIVCLCGSTRFKSTWYEQTKRLTYEGAIVLGVGDLDPNAPNINVPLDAELKAKLDELHKRKIDLADEVLILNCRVLTCMKCRKVCEADGKAIPPCSLCCRVECSMRPYIGISTQSELEYAKKSGKTIRFLESE